MSLPGTQLLYRQARPFLKWAGGKSQLIEQIAAHLPAELKQGRLRRYAEPFVGGGAMFFYVAQNYRFDSFLIVDANEELILAYRTIKRDVRKVIERLKEMQTNYGALSTAGRQEYFYAVRSRFNEMLPKISYNRFDESWIERTAQIVFLNRTCFNGLFRVNSKGEFNVPFGRYKNPAIRAEENLLEVSDLFQRTEIRLEDFAKCDDFVTGDTFVYFDPPYRPISKTSNFTSHSKYDLDENAHLQSATFVELMLKRHRGRLRKRPERSWVTQRRAA